MKKAFIDNLKANVLNREAQKTVVGGYGGWSYGKSCGSTCPVCWAGCTQSQLTGKWHCNSPGMDCGY